MIQLLALLLSVNALAADAPAVSTAPASAADAAPMASQAAAPTRSAEELDRTSEQSIKEFEDCVANLLYFRDDLKAKKESLDKEFNGKVPSAFANLMNLKANRISKQHSACAKMTDFQIDATMASLRTMDGDSAAYAARRKKLFALRERLNKAWALFAAAN